MRNESNSGAPTSFEEMAEGQALDATRHGEATREFEAFLRSKVVGQDAAIEAVTELYQIFLAGMASPDRPVGNLLFLGPTGSGKTYVVEVVAEALFGNPHAFIKVNCAEFQEHHDRQADRFAPWVHRAWPDPGIAYADRPQPVAHRKAQA